MKEKTCCFTGHRNMPLKDIPLIYERTKSIILELARSGVKYFGVGGAIGFDTLAAQLLMQLRDDEDLNIKIILVCPFPEFTSKWAVEQQKMFGLM